MSVSRDNFLLMRNTWLSFPRHDFFIFCQIDASHHSIGLQWDTISLSGVFYFRPWGSETCHVVRTWTLRTRYATPSLCTPRGRGPRSPGRRSPASRSCWWCSTRPGTPWTRPWPTPGSARVTAWRTSPSWRRRQSHCYLVHLYLVLSRWGSSGWLPSWRRKRVIVSWKKLTFELYGKSVTSLSEVWSSICVHFLINAIVLTINSLSCLD